MEAHGFDVDLVLEPRLSARRAWIVASAAGGLSLILATALVFVLPLRETQVFTVLVDRQTGDAENILQVAPTGIEDQEALKQSRIYRNDQVIWERPFVSGEENMTHSLANLEHHHFKYPLFRQPGQVHVHVFGTATLSFVDGVVIQDNDVMEIDCPQLGRPLRNPALSKQMPAPEVIHL